MSILSPLKINTSVNFDFKPPRINTSKKRVGVGVQLQLVATGDGRASDQDARPEESATQEPSLIRCHIAHDVTVAALNSPRRSNESHSERPAGSEESLFFGLCRGRAFARHSPPATRHRPRGRPRGRSDRKYL